MPEGDTLYRTAAGLRPYLLGRPVLAARATGGAQVGRLVGATVTSVDTIGKNLLLRFSNGLEVRTHLRMNGTWHRYRPGERWRRPAARAVLVLEVDGRGRGLLRRAGRRAVRRLERRGSIPASRRSARTSSARTFDAAEALRRLRDASRAEATIGEALLDQRVMAGVGNVYRAEILFLGRVDPFATVASLDDATLERLIATARRLLTANAERRGGPERSTTGRAREAGGAPLWVYGRAGRPCRRCGTAIRSTRLGRELPRTVWWCPACQ